jgi:hypothetical protein
MTGTGDPDLYVRFGAPPTQTSYSCRPYTSGASETCTLTVPTGATTAYVMVRGFTASTFSVTRTWTAPQRPRRRSTLRVVFFPPHAVKG